MGVYLFTYHHDGHDYAFSTKERTDAMTANDVKVPRVYGLAYLDAAGKFESWEREGVRWLNTWPKTYIAAVRGVPVDFIAAAKAEAIQEFVEFFAFTERGPVLDKEAAEFLANRGYKTLADQLSAWKGGGDE